MIVYFVRPSRLRGEALVLWEEMVVETCKTFRADPRIIDRAEHAPEGAVRLSRYGKADRVPPGALALLIGDDTDISPDPAEGVRIETPHSRALWAPVAAAIALRELGAAGGGSRSD